MLLKLNVVGTTSQQWSISSLILALDNSSDVRLRLNEYLVIGTFPKLVLESTARRTANLREGLKTKKPPPHVVPSFVPKVPEVPELDDYSLPVFPKVWNNKSLEYHNQNVVTVVLAKIPKIGAIWRHFQLDLAAESEAEVCVIWFS